MRSLKIQLKRINDIKKKKKGNGEIKKPPIKSGGSI